MELDLSGISLPFGVSDLVTGGMELFGLVAPFVILGLAFLFVPRIITIVRNSFGSGGRRA